MSTSLLEELQQAGVRLLLMPNRRMRWEAEREPPAELITKARASKEELRVAVLERRAKILDRYHRLERFLEQNLWFYVSSTCSPTLYAKYVSMLADIDLIEERLRREFGATECLSRHIKCTVEQVASGLCCDVCRAVKEGTSE